MSVSKIVAAAASGVGGAGLDVDEVFSTDLWVGTYYNENGLKTTVNNGIDLLGEGGLVWLKHRTKVDGHSLFDTARGYNSRLSSNNTNAVGTGSSDILDSFRSTGFKTGANATTNGAETASANSGNKIASWTFRKAKKFFDVVTYTGNGSNRAINHNLGGTVGMLVVKRTDGSGNWFVLDVGTGKRGYFDYIAAAFSSSSGLFFGDGSSYQAPTSTQFFISSNANINANGSEYVAYLFAHNNNDGGFGPDADQDIIKCGSYTGNGSTSGPTVNLGFEPQWIMIKDTTSANHYWMITDVMRGIPNGVANSVATLKPNGSDAEFNAFQIDINATGFQIADSHDFMNKSGNTYIYMAIRRGPLAVPDDATKVFAIDAATQDSSAETQSLGKYDSGWFFKRSTSEGYAVPRILGRRISFLNGQYAALNWDAGLDNSQGKYFSYTSDSAINYFLKRAPGFFDHLAYSGTGSVNTHQHNLTVQPEMMWIRKLNTSSADALVYHKDLSASTDLRLNTNAPSTDSNIYNNTRPTDTVFTVGTSSKTNDNEGSVNYYAMLFASVSGVSKVGSYTGNGSNQTIDCGFTAGARFILIRRADAGGYNSTVRYYVWDTVRGITSGSDPHIHLYRETTSEPSDSSINPHSSGFIVNEISATNINVSSASYIFYAIA